MVSKTQIRIYIWIYFCKILITILDDWHLVSDNSECSGSEEGQGKFETIFECAEKCQGVSSMFAFGTNDYGTIRCENGKCSCFCETAATIDGSCSIVSHSGFRLYKFLQNAQGRVYFYSIIK